MPRIVRKAEVAWEGTIARGSGMAVASSSSSFALPFTNASRIGEPEGKTSPEELLAAAHAGCFSMSLGSELARAGTPPEHLDVRCTITMDEVEGRGHQIIHSAIEATGVVPDCDEAGFAQAGEAADAGCPFSALIKASATVSVNATLEGI
ncbi:MAG: OsmC family peroxiredoxin [Gaiellaceae bacterium]